MQGVTSTQLASSEWMLDGRKVLLPAPTSTLAEFLYLARAGLLSPGMKGKEIE